MLNLKNKFKNLIGNETNIKDETVIIHQANNAKGYIDYASGLWINGWVAGADAELQASEEGYSNCTVKVNDQEVIRFSANIIRADLQAIPELKNGLGFDVQMPVQKLAKLIADVDSLEFSIYLDGSKIPHSIVVSKEEFYQKAFDNLYEDVNCYIANIPLFNADNVKKLTIRQKLFLLKSLFNTNLFKGLSHLTFEILSDLSASGEDILSVDDLIGELTFDEDFIAFFLRSANEQFSDHFLSSGISNALNLMPFHSAKELIESNISDEVVKNSLLENCITKKEAKDYFAEQFPDDLEEGLEVWSNLDKQLQFDYWPLIAECLQFKRLYKHLKFIRVDPSYYVKGEFDRLELNDRDILRLAIQENYWYALSFITQATVSGSDKAFLAELLKEHTWKVWGKEYFDVNTFSFITQELLVDGITEQAYNDLCEAYESVFKYLVDRNRGLMHDKVFVSGLVAVINFGISRQFISFTKLEEIARPELCLRNTYAKKIDLSPLQYFDYNFHSWLSEFYRNTEEVRSFFLNFKAHNDYKDIELVKVLQHLLKLKINFGVKDIDSRLLAISRYCLLTEKTQLYPFLKSIHLEMNDNYTALQLETNIKERLVLTKRITEHGKNSKRNDSYWFNTALSSRLDTTGEETKSFILGLENHLQQADSYSRELNPDLVDLLVSEVLWLSKSKISVVNEIDLISPVVAKTAINALAGLKLYSYFADNDISGLSNIELTERLESVIEGYESLSNILKLLNLEISSLQTDADKENLLSRIEQYYIYPYTKVLIYSCNKYESTRHKIIRNTWIEDLKKYGIDYSFIVGDAEKAFVDGDILRLNVLDTYEELPHKSMRMFEFAAESSFHRHYYKIDDDCILNVDAMFGDPAFLGSNYFGRIVERPVGGVDRSWHHLKSSTLEAKEALDLSPELSVYCDGSTGYMLSRLAVNKLLEQAASPLSTQLISSSYFEDKLIGDLLTQAGVAINNNGYNTVIRRNVASGRDVQIWDYGLLPNAATNIKVLHTESDEFREVFFKQLHSSEAAIPELIYRDVTTDLAPAWDSKTDGISPILEIIKIHKEKIQQARVVAIIVGKNEQEYLPALLEHHRKIGVEHFLFVDNMSTDSSIDFMVSQDDVSVFVNTQEYKTSRYGVDWQETLCSHYCLGKWALIIDSDELFMFDGFEHKKIQDLIVKAEDEGANAVLSPMIDFYPKESLETADITGGQAFYEVCSYFDSSETMSILTDEKYGPYSNSKVMSGGLRERIFGKYNAYPNPSYLNQKYNLFKYIPSMKLVEGLHFMHGHKKFSQECGIMHFKYHSGFHAKVMREVKSGQHWNGAKEYQRYLKLFDGKQSACLFSDAVSLKYTSSKSLVDAGYISNLDWKQ